MALATNSSTGTIYLNGDLHTSNDALAPELTATGVTIGTYNFPHVVVDVKGRTLYAVEATLDDVPCATDASCGIVKVGNTLLLAAGSPEIAGEISLPIANSGSPEQPGMVQIGSGITVNNGLISIQYDIATGGSPPTLGVVKIGSNLGITADGTLTRGGEGDATTSTKGIVQVGSNINVSSGIISLSNATSSTYGIVDSADTNSITISAGSINTGSNIALKDTFQPFTAPQNSPMQTIVDASGTINLDASVNKVFHITTNGDLTINSITNMNTNEQVDIIIDLGDLTAEDTLTLNSTFFKISGNTQSGQITLITCTQITTGGEDYAYTIIQPYME